MLRHWVFPAALCAYLLFLPSATVAQSQYSCADVQSSLLKDKNADVQRSLEDEHLYYYSLGLGKWLPMPLKDFHSLPAGDYSFAYVVREYSPSGRAGVLVIKSGRYEVPGRPAGKTKSVLMIRRDKVFTRTKDCHRPVQPFIPDGESVSAAAYDGYHDYGYQGPEEDMEKISRFHVTYETAGGHCVATDNATSDKTFPGFWRSNRSQFSFDDSVVDNGMGWQLADAGRNLFGRSYAAYGKFVKRKVEIRRYETTGSEPSCIRFSRRVGPDRFLSINDLENWSNDIRGPEERWNH